MNLKIKSILLTLTLTLPLRAGVLKTFETKHLADVEAAVAELTQTIPPARILVATDLDNTLLSMDTDLGSEHWYLWQKSLIEGGQLGFPAVADSTSGLLRVQDVITFLQKMHPTAEGLPAFYETLAGQGVARIVLTSRGLTTHDATVRELERNQIPLSSEADLGLAPGRVSGFDRGLYLTNGAHKGKTLRAFLKTAARQFDAVVFTDDRPHHVAGMNEAFDQAPEKLVSIQFTPVIDEINSFNEGDKRTVEAQWCALASGVAAGFPGGALSTEVHPTGCP